MGKTIASGIARLRRDQERLRKHLRRFLGALDALEARGEVARIAEFVSVTDMTCRSHFRLEEELALRLIRNGPPHDAAQVAQLLAQQRELRGRFDQVVTALFACVRERDPDLLQDLSYRALAVGRALASSLERDEKELVPILALHARAQRRRRPEVVVAQPRRVAVGAPQPIPPAPMFATGAAAAG